LALKFFFHGILLFFKKNKNRPHFNRTAAAGD